MAIAFPSASNTGGAANVTSRAPAVPAGAAVDDVMFVFLDIWHLTEDPAVTPASGFTQLFKAAGGSGVKMFCFWKRLTGADSGTYTFTYGAVSMWSTCSAHRVTGVKTSGDPVGANFDTQFVSSTNYPTVTLSPAYAPGLLWHGYNDAAATHTPPTGFTESVDVDSATAAWLVSGTSGSQSASGATASVTGPLSASLVAIEPAVVALTYAMLRPAVVAP